MVAGVGGAVGLGDGLGVGVVSGEMFGTWVGLLPMIGVQAEANKNSPAPRAAALDHPPLIV